MYGTDQKMNDNICSMRANNQNVHIIIYFWFAYVTINLLFSKIRALTISSLVHNSLKETIYFLRSIPVMASYSSKKSLVEKS